MEDRSGKFLTTFLKAKEIHKKKSHRILSLLLIASFSSNAIAFSAPALPASPISTTQIQIPEAYGAIEETYNPSSQSEEGPFLIYIQDAHSQPEAQRNIAAILSHLHHSQKLSGVALEGAFGEVKPDVLNFFDDEEANQAFRRYVLEKGELTGAELFGLDPANKTAHLYGVEDWELYKKGFAAFYAVKSRKKEVREILDAYEHALSDLERRAFSKPLQSFMSAKRAWDEKEGNTAQSLKILSELAREQLLIDFMQPASQFRWPNMTRLVKSMDLENSLKPEISASELAEIKKEIGKYQDRDDSAAFLVSGLDSFSGAGTEWKNWLSSNAERKGIKSAREFTEKLYGFSKRHDLHLSLYPEFLKLAGILILREEMDSAGLLVEIRDIEKQLEAKLVQTEAEKNLFRLRTSHKTSGPESDERRRKKLCCAGK